MQLHCGLCRWNIGRTFLICIVMWHLVNCADVTTEPDDTKEFERELEAIFNTTANYNFSSQTVGVRENDRSKVEILGETLKQHVASLRQTVNKQVELVFLVDSSASVGEENFFNELKFVRKLLADFTVSFNTTRVAVITFSSRNRVVRHVDHITRPTKENHKCILLEEQLPKITYTGGGTYTLGAILQAQEVLKHSRPEARKAIFLITDGYSNGGDPRPAAKVLRDQGVEIFTFGIRNGNVRELYDMASDPPEQHSYILDSFEEFEALARRALHEDLHIGSYVIQNSGSCNGLCIENNDCCNDQAQCTCGTHTGHYACLCKPGYYGTGIKGNHCTPCPPGTYRPTAGPGDISTCITCPDPNHTSPEGSISIDQCQCKPGFQPAGEKCLALHCPELKPPKHGYFVNDLCNNVFNAACGIRCNPGYRLIGSSIRLCSEDGTWTGEDAVCELKECPSISSPLHGSMKCNRESFVFETECHFSCDSGYTLVGSKKRTCLAVALWDGLPAFCRPITCNPLFPLRHGTVEPFRCTETKSNYADVCIFSCDLGYTLKGPKETKCMDTGEWSTQKKKTKCVDIEPPVIQCPEDIVKDTEQDESSAFVEWPLPIASDNTGMKPAISVIPVVISPQRFEIGITSITYIAEDLNQNRAECNFTISVRDVQPPTVDQCISPKPFLSTTQFANVTWEEPIFSDNSGKPVTTWQSHKPGLFPIGTTEVIYEALDDAGNNSTCIITITVQEHACSIPPHPMNGFTNCTKTADGVVCILSCMDGYAFAVSTPPSYFCAYDGIWLPPQNLPFPDCSVIELSNSVSQTALVTVVSNTISCENSFLMNQIEVHIHHKLANKLDDLCQNALICIIENTGMNCNQARDVAEEASNIIYRRRRSTGGNRRKRASPQDLGFIRQRGQNRQSPSTNVDQFLQVYSTMPVPTAETSNVYQWHDTNHKTRGNDQKADVGYTNFQFETYPFISTSSDQPILQTDDLSKVVGHTYSIPQVISSEADTMSSKSPDDADQDEILLAFKLIGKTEHPSNNPEIQKLLTERMAFVMKSLEHAVQAGELDVTMGAKVLKIKSIEFPGMEPEFLCEPGSIHLKNKCVKCPVGTYFNIMEHRCNSCPQGTYQFQEGQLSCVVCPENTSTTKEQSKSIEECKAQCLPGSFSATGLEPCQTCPVGFYQGSYARMKCEPCPKNTTTKRRGSRKLEDCVASCPKGYVSRTGLQPCFPCPIGYFQPSIGSNSCFPCPGRVKTTKPGASSLTECEGTSAALTAYNYYEDQLLTINDCFSVPCLNGATCNPLEFGYTCTCLEGYTGIHCEVEINECSSNPCQHNAACQDLIGTYKCFCQPGFTGNICEEDINDCASDPCYNNATCIDQLNSFHCQCQEGYVGAQCELNYDDCQNFPCKNGGSCIDSIANYTCTCLPGYSGRNCEINIDDCQNNKCQNNATCIDGLQSYRCDCLPGYRGKFCEQDINECETMPCHNGATCMDLVGHFKCICAPAYTGELCETEIPSDFTLQFPSSGTMDFVYVENLGSMLDEVCICFWMQTNDKQNYGTPFSYANDTADNLLTLTDYNGFVLYVNMRRVVTDVTANDGMWHHICVTWKSSDGSWIIYKDGVAADKGKGLATNTVIPANGVFIVGQEQDSRGSDFSAPESFLGSITLLQIWNYALKPDDIASLLTRCDVYHGNVKVWPDFSAGIRGNVERIKSDLCAGCTRLDPPKYGEISLSGTGTSSVAVYSCDPGYNLVGPTTRKCLVFGEWSWREPTCERISCGFPGFLRNGFLNNHHYYYQSVIQYFCNPGYQLIGNDKRVCQVNGTWSGDLPRCEEISCTLPSPPEHGQIVNAASVIRPRNQIEFVCDDGFRLHGSDILTCNELGQWDKSVPSCQPKSCDSPVNVPHGHLVGIQKDFHVGSVVHYECEDGYEMQGSGQMRCVQHNHWEGELPQCERVLCGPPPLFPNAAFDGDDFHFGGIVSYHCELGYQLSLQVDSKINSAIVNMTCNANGTWEGDAPVCQPISCGELLPPLHGDIDVADFTYGSIARYFCHTGYELQGVRSRKCRATGEWSGRNPRCLPISCSPPEPIPNGRYIGSDWTVGNTVSYVCSPGYILMGDSERICLETGQWLNQLPHCEPIRCPQPEPIAHAIITGNDMRFGQRVEYQCEAGYELVGQAQRVCMEDKKWVPEPPVCRPVSCHQLPPIENGFVRAENSKFGSYAKYECQEGFSLVGPAKRACQANGQWDGFEPYCEIISCSEPSLISHGHVLFTDTKYGSVVEYYCDKGYQLKGSIQRICGPQGEWSDHDPVCNLVECVAPIHVENADVYSTGQFYGNITTYTCHRGYELVGAINQTCQADGTWSHPPPRCEPIHCSQENLTIANGQLIGTSTTVGSTIQYVCNTGYHLVGPSYLTCGENKLWNQLPPKCQKIKCAPPMVPAHGRITGKQYSFGSTIEYSCFTGYELHGFTTRVCLENGMWDGHRPQCLPVECPPPKAPENGSVNITGLQYHSTAEYFCNPGYELSTLNNKRKCQANKQWSKEVPTCRRIRCPDPLNVPNAFYQKRVYTAGERLDYKCKKGFKQETQRNATFVCSMDGKWIGGPSACTPITCPHPEPLKFGRIIGDNYTYGNTIEFLCNPGWEIIGNSKLRCTEGGEWSSAFPTCVGIKCPTPETISYGHMRALDIRYGATITYECNPGFYLKGNVNRTCQIDNTWDVEAPKCLPVACPSPPDIENGKRLDTQSNMNFTYNMTATYVCDKGYMLHGPANITCLANGSWTSNIPVCQKLRCPNPESVENGEIFFYDPVNTSFAILYEEEPTIPHFDNHIRGDIMPGSESLLFDVLHTPIFKYEDQILYKCLIGYQLKGKSLRICQSDGTWSSEAPVCQPISCKNLHAPEHGYTMSSLNEYQGKTVFACHPGYRMVGTPILECLADGRWSSDRPSCQAVLCPKPQPIAHGQVTWNALSYRSTAAYRCNPGYKLIGKAIITCGDKGQWVPNEPHCEVIQCLPPEVPEHGWVRVDDYIPGSVAKYYCNERYELLGSHVRTCLTNQTWSLETPTCVMISCPPFPEIPYGYVIGSSFVVSSSVRVECQPGFELRGEAIQTCLPNGVWSGPGLPQCIPMECNAFTIPSNTIISSVNRAVGSKISFRCMEGFRLDGNAEITCLPDKSWSHPLPRCQQIVCPSITHLQNGIVSGRSVTIGSILKFQCKNNYKLYGPSEITCLGNGIWSSEVPKCLRHQCEEPPAFHNTLPFNGSFEIGQKIMYSCIKGYKLEGTGYYKCTEEGTWEGYPIACIPITCPPLPKLTEGLVLVSQGSAQKQKQHTVGTTVIYDCLEGYELQGNRMLTCQDDGQWTGSVPHCITDRCALPAVPLNAKVDLKHTGNVWLATYSCEAGYKLTGQEQHFCTLGETWNVNGIMCERITCGKAPPLKHGIIQAQENFYPGMSANYSCIPGFRLIGNPTVHCQEDGKWMGLLPRCLPISCLQPPPIAHGEIEGSDFSFQQSVTYRCHKGYKLYGREKRFCEANGLWSGDNPICRKVSCPELTHLKNGIIIKTDGRQYGDKVFFVCDSGYQLKGSENSECLENSTWSNPIPRCEAITCPPFQIPQNAIQTSLLNEPFLFGQVVNFTCLPGYQPTGTMMIKCLEDGNWSPFWGSCNRISCGKPKVTKGAMILGASFLYQDKVVLLCPPGSKPSKSSILTCSSNGIWSGEPVCEAFCPKTCKNGGTCVPPGICDCPQGFVGDSCQTAICILPCLHGGTCAGPFNCHCRKGYTGTRCEKAVCKLQCLNGGWCKAPNKCQCPPRYSGLRCEIIINDFGMHR